MDIIRWRESYEIGIGSMDMQHRKIIELINKLYKVIRKEEPSGSIEEILDEMAKYAEKHLKEEEAILKTNDYPELANHIAAHQRYLDRLKTLMPDSKKEKEAAAKDVYVFLRHWWVEHIVAEDRKYGDFLRSKGVK